MSRKPLQKVDRPPLLHQTVQVALREFIDVNGLRPGDALPSEGDLALQLGVSRNSVREAVKAMESTGVLEARRGSGVFVAAFSLDALLDHLPYGLIDDLSELSDLLDVRRALEIGLVGQALPTISAERISALRAVLVEMREHAKRHAGFPEQDRIFHRTLFEATGNRVMLRLLDVFWLAWQRAAESIDIQDRTPLRTYQDHVAIVDAVESGDAVATRAALEHHYKGIQLRLLETERGDRRPTGTT